MKHPVLDYLLISAACDVNDRHNEKMLREGRYIPWWKRHLLLTIVLSLTVLPVLLVAVGLLVLIGLGDFATVGGGWPFSILAVGLIVGGIWYGYHRSEQRWNRQVHKPTKVVSVRRGP